MLDLLRRSNRRNRSHSRTRNNRGLLRQAVRSAVEKLEPRMLMSLAGSTFESLDGNLIVNTSGNLDWITAPNFASKTDAPTGQNDDSFGSGGEGSVAPTITTGSIPNNKSDLLRFYIGHETVNNTTDFLYLGWVRASNDTTGPNGSANIDFEFDQSRTLSANGVTPIRTPGDILITYDFSNGGATADINYRVWDGSAWGASLPLSSAGFAEGAVNTTTVTDPLSGNASLAPNCFGEAAINLTAAGIFSPNNLTNFGSVYVKSRSSSAFNSDLKDFIAPLTVNISNGAVISGHKFNDLNGDGAWEAGEPALANWTINLEDTNNNILQTTTTGADGSYTFITDAGTYRLREGNQAGWMQTSANPADLTVALRQQSPNHDFGNFHTVSLSGAKYKDLTGDGLTADDTPLAGVSFNLFKDTDLNGVLDGGDTLMNTATSAAVTGAFAFNNVGPGTYFVSEVVPAGSLQTYPGGSGYYTVTTSSGTNTNSLNFANVPNITISGTKFNDLTGNGITADDTGLGGVTISLYRDQDNDNALDAGDGAPVLTTVTLANGSYAFHNLLPGRYFVQETVPAGAMQIVPNSPAYYTVNASGLDVTGLNFANFSLASISGKKVLDLTGNGLTADDTGMGGVTINLYKDTNASGTLDANDSLVASTTSAANTGAYAFANLAPGTYFVQEAAPAGYTQTGGPAYYTVTTTSGLVVTGDNFANFRLETISGRKVTDITGNGITADDTGLGGVTITLYKDTNPNGVLDANDSVMATTASAAGTGAYSFSNVGPGTYFVAETIPGGYMQIAPAGSGYFTLTTSSLGDSANNNFANFQLGSISGKKVLDLTGNGLSADDTGLGGVTIKLFKDTNPNGVLDAGDTIVDTTTSAAGTGAYAFSNIAPGSYFVAETPPAGYLQTAPNAPAYYTVNATSGMTVTGDDFANFRLEGISGRKVTDLTGDGFTADDIGLGGVTIKLYKDTNPNGILDASDTVVATTTSAAGTGAFSFANVAPGTYFVAETVPAGYIQIAPAGPAYYTVTTNSQGDSVGNDFANFQLASISGKKVLDITGNGFTADDTGLGGITIKLYKDTNPNGILDANDTVMATTTTTAGTGAYSFANVAPGNYFVQETLPAGYIQTGGPAYYSVAATSGLAVTGDNFANFRLAGIGGRKVTDITGNGITADDTGLGGVTINLYKDDGNGTLDANDSLLDSMITAPSTGYYYFDDIGPGTYFVSEVVPSGYMQTAPAGAGYYTITPTSLGDSLYNNFANFKLFCLSGVKWEDHNGNGLRDAGDQGLPNWTISLTLGAQTWTTTTDANGNYSFPDLGPGNYSVAEVNQAGWTCTYGKTGYQFTANSGVNLVRSFGNFQNYSISGQKFQDMNGNGIKDAGDLGLPGFHITLDGQDMATTDANGNYTINNVGPGSHTISEIQQAGWTMTTPTLTCAGSSGINVTGKDVGNFKNITVMSQKFLDANFNGLRDPGEVGLDGWTIQAVNAQGQVIASAITQDVDLDNSGTIDPVTERGIATLSIGAGSFKIREVLKSGWVQFAPATGFYTILVGGDLGIQSGTTLTGMDFGNAPLVSHDSKTLGFWSNKNGQAILKSTDSFASALLFLRNMNLKDGAGADFNPLSYAGLRGWMLRGKATNMAYMLSVQMATLALNVRYNFVPGGAMVYAPSLLPYASQLGSALSSTGVISVTDLLNFANSSLASNPLTKSASAARNFQGALESVIDGCNNGQNYLS